MTPLSFLCPSQPPFNFGPDAEGPGIRAEDMQQQLRKWVPYVEDRAYAWSMSFLSNGLLRVVLLVLLSCAGRRRWQRTRLQVDRLRISFC